MPNRALPQHTLSMMQRPPPFCDMSSHATAMQAMSYQAITGAIQVRGSPTNGRTPQGVWGDVNHALWPPLPKHIMLSDMLAATDLSPIPASSLLTAWGPRLMRSSEKTSSTVAMCCPSRMAGLKPNRLDGVLLICATAHPSQAACRSSRCRSSMAGVQHAAPQLPGVPRTLTNLVDVPSAVNMQPQPALVDAIHVGGPLDGGDVHHHAVLHPAAAQQELEAARQPPGQGGSPQTSRQATSRASAFRNNLPAQSRKVHRLQHSRHQHIPGLTRGLTRGMPCQDLDHCRPHI
jgi:hypothetical protein